MLRSSSGANGLRPGVARAGAGVEEAQVLLRRQHLRAASASTPGAMTASRKVSASARAVASSTSRLSATMPPKADTSSTARAVR